MNNRCSIDPRRRLRGAGLSAALLLACVAAPAAIGEKVDTVSFTALDIPGLVAQEEADRADGNPKPDRFAVAEPAAISPQNAGTISRTDDGRVVWRVRLESPNAKNMNLGMLYEVPPSTRLYLLDADGMTEYRALTASDNKDHGEFWTPPVEGRVLELYAEVAEDEFAAFANGLQVFSVNMGYQSLRSNVDPDANRQVSCNIDVACHDSGQIAESINAVGRQIVSGSFLCSGALVNNTAEDGRALWLTAEHCGLTNGNDQTLVVSFNYENSSCRTPGSGQSGAPGNGSTSQFVSGSQLLMRYEPADTALAELSSTPPGSWGVYYAGWDRRAIGNTSSYGIHHPAGEEKRISFDDQASSFVNGGFLHQVVYDEGAVEGGSSGSPLFNGEGRVRGPACCVATLAQPCAPNKVTFYGSMHRAWTGDGTPSGSLAPHLDPLGTGAEFVNGLGDGAPTAFDLVSPADGAADVPLPATLDWQSAALAFEYEVEVRDASNAVVFSATTSAAQVTLDSSALTPGTAYTWTVSATNASGSTSSSNGPFSFSTLETRGPASFDLVSPGAGETGVATLPTFDWDDSDRATTYRLFVQDTRDNSTVLLREFAAGASEYDMAAEGDSPLADGVEHRWGVIAFNANGNLPPSGGVHLFTVGDAVEPCPADLSGDGVVNADDLLEVLGNFGGAGPDGDTDGNGTVNADDLLAVLAVFGSPCP